MSALALLPGVFALAGPRTAQAATAPLSAHVRVGAFVDGMVEDPSRLTAWEQQVGGKAAVASYFYGFGDVFPGPVERTLSADGQRTLLLSWDMGSGRFTDWSSGRYDAYLRQIGAAAKAFGRPFYVRPWPEMNGDWQDFQPTPSGDRPAGGTPAQFVAAWRHVVSTVRAAGGTDVRWVFNPTADTYAGTTDITTIWPGRQYVDVLGLDGYNWGGGPQPWRSFTQIFADQYGRITALDPTLPVWICETSSREPSETDGGLPVDPSHSKASWITQAFASTGFPRVTVVSWFDIDKERDWRVASSAGSLTAFRAVMGKVGASATAGAASPTARWSGTRHLPVRQRLR